MLSRLVITFLPRSKRLLISWLQSPSAVILEPRKIKSPTVSTVSPSISHEVMGPDAMIFIFWMLSSKPTFSLSTFSHESKWTLGVCDGQGGLACCDSWGRRVGHDWVTEPNRTKLNIALPHVICSNFWKMPCELIQKIDVKQMVSPLTPLTYSTSTAEDKKWSSKNRFKN